MKKILLFIVNLCLYFSTGLAQRITLGDEALVASGGGYNISAFNLANTKYAHQTSAAYTADGFATLNPSYPETYHYAPNIGSVDLDMAGASNDFANGEPDQFGGTYNATRWCFFEVPDIQGVNSGGYSCSGHLKFILHTYYSYYSAVYHSALAVYKYAYSGTGSDYYTSPSSLSSFYTNDISLATATFGGGAAISNMGAFENPQAGDVYQVHDALATCLNTSSCYMTGGAYQFNEMEYRLPPDPYESYFDAGVVQMDKSAGFLELDDPAPGLYFVQVYADNSSVNSSCFGSELPVLLTIQAEVDNQMQITVNSLGDYDVKYDPCFADAITTYSGAGFDMIYKPSMDTHVPPLCVEHAASIRNISGSDVAIYDQYYGHTAGGSVSIAAQLLDLKNYKAYQCEPMTRLDLAYHFASTTYSGGTYHQTYHTRGVDYDENGIATTPTTYYRIKHNALLNDARSMEAFPNPTNGQVTIKLKNVDDAATITVTDLQGRVMKSYSLNATDTHFQENILDLSGLSTGIYIVQVTGTNTNLKKRISLQ